jgi:hypothetical protein
MESVLSGRNRAVFRGTIVAPITSERTKERGAKRGAANKGRLFMNRIATALLVGAIALGSSLSASANTTQTSSSTQAASASSTTTQHHRRHRRISRHKAGTHMAKPAAKTSSRKR